MSDRHHDHELVLLAAILLVVMAFAGVCEAAVTTPTIDYPEASATAVRWNPAIFWQPMTESPGCTGNNCTQRDAQVQIATASAFGSGDIVWENWSCDGSTSATGCAYGGGFSIHVDQYHGDFKNALSGQVKLAAGSTYYVRVRLQTMNTGNAWSSWSSSSRSFTTRAAYSGTTYYVRTNGDDANCTGVVDADYPGSGSGQPCAFATVSQAHSSVAAGGTIQVSTTVTGNVPNFTKDITLTMAAGAHWQPNTNVNVQSPMRFYGAHVRGSTCTTNAQTNGFLVVSADDFWVDDGGVLGSGGLLLDCASRVAASTTGALHRGWVIRGLEMAGNGDGMLGSTTAGSGIDLGLQEYLALWDVDVHSYRNCTEKYGVTAGAPGSHYLFDYFRCSDNFNHNMELRGVDYSTWRFTSHANNAMEFGEGITTPANDGDAGDCGQYYSVEFSSSDIGHSFSDGVGANGSSYGGTCTGSTYDVLYLHYMNNAVDSTRTWGVCSGDQTTACDEDVPDCTGKGTCNLNRSGCLSVGDSTDDDPDRVTTSTRYSVDYNLCFSTSQRWNWDSSTDNGSHTTLAAFRSDCGCAANDDTSDPKFVEPQGWGATAYDHTPQAGSAAIDGASPAYDPRYGEAIQGHSGGGSVADVGSVEVDGGSSPPAIMGGVRGSGVVIR